MIVLKFCNFLLRVDGIREASIDDFKSVIEKGLRTYRPEHQKYLYSIEMEIIDDCFSGCPVIMTMLLNFGIM